MTRGDYKGTVAQFISSYLSPPVSRIILDEKFCMIDNLGPAGDASDVGNAGYAAIAADAANIGDAPFGTPVESPVRFPVRITMSCCLFCKSGSISFCSGFKDIIRQRFPGFWSN